MLPFLFRRQPIRVVLARLPVQPPDEVLGIIPTDADDRTRPAAPVDKRLVRRPIPVQLDVLFVNRPVGRVLDLRRQRQRDVGRPDRTGDEPALKDAPRLHKPFSLHSLSAAMSDAFARR